MGLDLVNLDATTRAFMLQEVERDVAEDKLYYSPRLSPAGRQAYPEVLRNAVRGGTDGNLAADLRTPGLLNATEVRRKPKGGTTVAQVPITAPETLAEGEFNRFYARGLCLRATSQGADFLLVYRAKEVADPRPESVALIGKSLPAKQLLEDLRTSVGADTALGLPPGPNSGLSVRLP
ncbi:MAG TPA: hypothetical protein VLY23_09850 [Candidatus Acidoferrum sp.]|nr:hypothetical protein [Candidatus Acidoferrum sp.]